MRRPPPDDPHGPSGAEGEKSDYQKEAFAHAVVLFFPVQ